MRGICRHTGAPIGGIAYLEQRITDVLTTSIDSRIMLRPYGSRLRRLTDAPVNQGLALQLYAATAGALQRWISDFRLTRVQLVREDAPGAFRLELEGEQTDQPRSLAAARISIPLRVSAGGLITA